MQFNAPTFRFPPTVSELRFPADVVVETALRVWAFSRWRDNTELARGFLRAGFNHLPAGSPVMFHLEERRHHATAPVIGLVAYFTNSIFPAARMNTFPYYLGDDGVEEE
ncbi:unnamed protein product [Alopecurus aequalis]